MSNDIVPEKWPLEQETFIVSLALVPKDNTKEDLPWPLPYFFITGNRQEAINKAIQNINELFDAHEKSTGRKFGE